MDDDDYDYLETSSAPMGPTQNILVRSAPQVEELSDITYQEKLEYDIKENMKKIARKHGLYNDFLKKYTYKGKVGEGNTRSI